MSDPAVCPSLPINEDCVATSANFSFNVPTVTQFTVYGSSEQITQISRQIVGSCADNTNVTNWVIASMRVAICNDLHVLKFVPGFVNESDIGAVQTLDALLNADNVLRKSNLDYSRESVIFLQFFYNNFDFDSVKTVIFERLWNNVEILAQYADVGGYFVIVQVPEGDLFFARQILGVFRNFLTSIPCYVCPTFPELPVTTCNKRSVNCDVQYPCGEERKKRK